MQNIFCQHKYFLGTRIPGSTTISTSDVHTNELTNLEGEHTYKGKKEQMNLENKEQTEKLINFEGDVQTK